MTESGEIGPWSSGQSAGRHPQHHPSDALLVGYGAGGLGEGLSLAVALHLAACPECRAALADIQAVGGALLDDLPPEPLERLTLADTLARLDREGCGAPPRRRCPPEEAGTPDLLRPYIGSLAAVPWQRLAPGVRRAELLPRTTRGGCAQLLRIAPGTALPHHGHGGLELTLVLAGSFSDELGRYVAGDIAEADGDVRHQPIADSHEECLCLIATEAPLRFTGLMGRLMQPFIGL